MKCSATTVAGKPCRNEALPNGDRCRVHRVAVDEEALRRVDQFLRTGSYPEVAAAAGGFAIEDLPPEVRSQIGVVRAELEVAVTHAITKAARDGNWQAAAWLLERQYPERWSRPSVRQQEEPPVETSDVLDELAQRREARRAGVSS